jgi:hypothetical protein
VLSSWLSGCCFRTWRMAREEGADSPRGAFGPGVLRVLRVFLSTFVLIRLASGFWWKVFGGQSAWTSRTVRAARVACGPSEDVVQTVRVWRCRLGCSASV